MNDKIDALERLARLVDGGKITEAEYAALKLEVLSAVDGGRRDDVRTPGEPLADQQGSTPKPPGWYPDEDPSQLHFWDGEKWAGRTRPAKGSSGTFSASKSIRDWRVWTGSGLVLLGLLAAFATVVRSNGPPESGALWFNLLINPLVWAGIAGVFLLYRWKETNTDGRPITSDSKAIPTRDSFAALESKKVVSVILLGITSGYWGLEAFVAIDFVLPEPILMGVDGPGLMSEVGTWYGLLLLATAASFVAWSYSAHANLSRLGRTSMVFSDHAAIWWWFVPVASLFMPYRVIFETVRGTVARLDDDDWQAHEVPSVARWWAYSFVAGVLLIGLSESMIAAGLGSRDGVLHPLGPVLLSVAAFSGARLVSKTTASQAVQSASYRSRRRAESPQET